MYSATAVLTDKPEKNLPNLVLGKKGEKERLIAIKELHNMVK